LDLARPRSHRTMKPWLDFFLPGFLSGVVVFAVAMAILEAWPKRHGHKWTVGSAYCDGDYHYLDAGRGQPFGHFLATHVVFKCECGETRDRTIPGRHTLEALRAEDSEIQRVLNSIK
jgi:hypothetical protein